MNKQKGLAPILIVLLIALAVGGYLLYQKQTKPTVAPQPVTQSSPSPVTSPTSIASTDTANWKIYTGDSYSISYPQSWQLDPSLKGLNAVSGKEGFVILSSDYRHNIGGYIEEGAVIRLFIGRKPFSGKLGLESEEQTIWVGEKATLSVYKYEGNNLVLTTTIKDIDYQLVMSTTTDGIRNINKDLFLKIAASLRPS